MCARFLVTLLAAGLLAATPASAQSREWTVNKVQESGFCSLMNDANGIAYALSVHVEYGAILDVEVRGPIVGSHTVTVTFDGGSRYVFPAEHSDDGVMTIDIASNDDSLRGFIGAFISRSEMKISAPGLGDARISLRGTSRGFDDLMDCVQEVRQASLSRSSIPGEYDMSVNGWRMYSTDDTTCVIAADVSPNGFFIDFHKDTGGRIVVYHERLDLDAVEKIIFMPADGEPFGFDAVADDGAALANVPDVVELLVQLAHTSSSGVMIDKAGWVFELAQFDVVAREFVSCMDYWHN